MSSKKDRESVVVPKNTSFFELLWERCKLFYGSCITFLLILVAFTGIASRWYDSMLYGHKIIQISSNY